MMDLNTSFEQFLQEEKKKVEYNETEMHRL